MKILHITDFHIDSPNSETEKLRDGFFEEYIDSLYKTISEAGVNDIDLVINTGDFINIGKIENYTHAKKVLDYTLKKFGLTNKDLAITIGNHDFQMKVPGTLEEKRKPFKDFSLDYQPGILIDSTQTSALYHDKDKKQLILIIDNASREDDINEPVNISVTEQDRIIKIIRENRWENNLIVVSHYPFVPFPLGKYQVEDSTWTQNHVWPPGLTLSSRICTTVSSGRVFFFCGDGHIPDAFKNKNGEFIMTGMLGGIYGKRTFNDKPFHIQIQARVYDTESEIPLWTFNYKPEGFDYDVTSGIWYYENSSLRELQENKKTHPTKATFRTNSLGSQLEEKIIEQISNNGLYKLGRYKTSQEHSSLGWISINKLFEEKQILISIIDKAIDWVDKIALNKNNSILIGVDFYGAILASHLGIRTGIQNRCISENGPSESDIHILSEIVSVLKSITGKKEIFILTDVVASGSTVLKIIEKIEKLYLESMSTALECNFHSISIISDKTIKRDLFDEKLTSIATACSILKMPIIKNDELPSNEILAARLDFTN